MINIAPVLQELSRNLAACTSLSMFFSTLTSQTIWMIELHIEQSYSSLLNHIFVGVHYIIHGTYSCIRDKPHCCSFNQNNHVGS